MMQCVTSYQQIMDDMSTVLLLEVMVRSELRLAWMWKMVWACWGVQDTHWSALAQGALIAQLGERQTEDLKVLCSIHSQSTDTFYTSFSTTQYTLNTHQIYSLFPILLSRHTDTDTIPTLFSSPSTKQSQLVGLHTSTNHTSRQDATFVSSFLTPSSPSQ